MKSLGFWAFVIGLILAIVAGLFFFDASWVLWVLLLLGLIIGLLNVTGAETVTFLVAAIALIVVGNVFGPLGSVGEKIGHVMTMIAALMAPAAIVVAIKALWNTAKS